MIQLCFGLGSGLILTLILEMPNIKMSSLFNGSVVCGELTTLVLCFIAIQLTISCLRKEFGSCLILYVKLSATEQNHLCRCHNVIMSYLTFSMKYKNIRKFCEAPPPPYTRANDNDDICPSLFIHLVPRFFI